MHKHTIFSLLMTVSIAIQGMEISPANSESLILLTKQLHHAHNGDLRNIGQSIQALSLTNKAWNSCCNNNAKNIITMIAQFNKISDMHCAKKMNCNTIYERLNKLYHKFYYKLYYKAATLKLNAKDLDDPWYLNASMDADGGALASAIICHDIESVRVLIKHGANVNGGQHAYAEGKPCKSPLMHWYDHKDLPIAQLLLENNANPNHRRNITNETPLMRAVKNENKQYAQLLIQHGANPHLLVMHTWTTALTNSITQQDIERIPLDTLLPEYNEDAPWLMNAFTPYWNQPWLKPMFDEITTTTDQSHSSAIDSTEYDNDGPPHKKQKLNDTMDFD